MRQHKEADVSIKFRHWIKANPMESATFEIKDTRGKKSFTMAELKENQINYGLAIESDNGVLIRCQGIGGNPDYVYYRNAPAYIVIKYPKVFYIIDIKDLVKESTKTLSEDRANEICKYKV